MLINHNIVSREPVLRALEELSPERLYQDVHVGNKSIRNLLVHIMNTERYWISILRGVKEEYLNPDEFIDIKSIRETWCKIESQTLEFITELPEEHLYHVRNTVIGDNTVTFTIGKALIHIITHEIHHRGLIIGLIRQLGLEPPNVNML